MSFNPGCIGKGRTNQPIRTLKEFAAIKEVTNIQMRSIWEHSFVAKPYMHMKCSGHSNRHYYLLSELEDWFTRDRASLNARVLGNHQISTATQ